MNNRKSLLRLLLLVSFCLATVTLHAQVINKTFKNETLKTVLKEVEQQTGLSVIYKTDEVNENKRITATFKNASLDEVLNKVLDKDLTYKLQNKMIVILKKTQKPHDGSTKKNIKGTVVDDKGEPIIGASVVVKGTSTGIITDLDGNYTINEVSEDAWISVSYIGYQSVELRAADSKNLLRIVLKEDTKVLDEVVVVGYGVQKKSDITGSVSSVKSAELLSAPNASTAQALQGRVAGVVVQNSSGAPSGSATIRIRGANSLTYGNDPLIIIDGVQDGNIGSLNPNQIESIEVLKDAAALSVYGSKGANGVILVTTKNGKTGKPQVSYNGFVSFDEVRKTLPALNAKEYALLMSEAQEENGLNPVFGPDEIPLEGNSTDWQDKIFRNAVSQSHNISISGAKESISYFIAGGYTNKDGIVQNTNFKQYTFRANFKVQATSRLNLSLNTFASYDETHNGDYEQAINAALQWSPTKRIYDPDSEGGYTQPGGGIGPVSLYNPVGYALEIVDDKSVASFNASLMGEYKFWDFLKLSSLFSYKTHSDTNGYFDNQRVNNGDIRDINGSKAQSRYIALQSTSILTFDKAFGDHTVQATGVYEVLKDNYQSTSASSRGIPVGMGYNGVQFGSILQAPWVEYSTTVMQSFMGRVNYSYKNKYMFSGSVRYDGASQLAEGNKYDNFTAFSLGWNLMEEKFMKRLKDMVPEFKIRGSYGTVGNAAVPAYSSHLKFYPGMDDSGNPTLAISDLGNENLKWERTRELNIGIDSRWWGGRLSFSAEYYNKKTTDLLMWQKVPSVLGVSSILTNVGSVSNKGFDIMLGGIPVSTKHFKWDINYTLNINKNKILELDGLSNTLITTGADYPGLVGSYVQMVGQPMGTFLGYTFAGVWQKSEVSTAALYGAKPGDAKYVDINRDGKIDKDDIGIIGNAQPKLSFGFNNTFTIFDFDLNIFWQGVSGNDIYNQNRIRRETYSSDAFPTSTVMKNHWTPENPTNIPAFSGAEYVNSSRWVEKGDYLRLKNITLGYRIPHKILSKIGCSSARIYVSANNLWTIPNYSGFDPEASMGADSDAAGVDRGVYPSSKSFLVGLDISF